MGQKPALSHLGVIMDGNRRWAKNQGLPTLEGHRRGYEKLKDLAKWCLKRNIKVLTIYAFSVENWRRSPKEVSYLMRLLYQGLERDGDELDRQGIRVKVIGQRQRLAPEIQQAIRRIESKTRNNKKLLFQIALSYGGRPEIIEAVKKIVAQKIPSSKITEQVISDHLWTAGVADPDVIVRTSGEQRLSNFLTWQSVYSELIFIKKHWPDFRQQDLDQIIKEYYRRTRRFGK